MLTKACQQRQLGTSLHILTWHVFGAGQTPCPCWGSPYFDPSFCTCWAGFCTWYDGLYHMAQLNASPMQRWPEVGQTWKGRSARSTKSASPLPTLVIDMVWQTACRSGVAPNATLSGRDRAPRLPDGRQRRLGPTTRNCICRAVWGRPDLQCPVQKQR